MSRAQTAGTEPGEPARAHVSPAVCLGVAAALGLLWLFDLYVLKTPVLTPFPTGERILPALTPLYAFWLPALRPAALGFAVVAVAAVILASRLSDPARTPRAWFAAALVTLAVVLPLALFGVRQSPAELGSQLLTYPGEEVYFDALAIREYRPFLAHYVELMPRLSLHGRHFPPGHASLLYAVGRSFGRGPFPAAAAVLACFALGIAATYLALARSYGERAGRQGALLVLASPAALDFACTSMDAVFFALAAVCAWLMGVIGLVRRAPMEETEPAPAANRLAAPLLTGVALFVAACFSFSAFPLGLAIGLAIAFAGRRSPGRALAALAAIAAGFAVSALLFHRATGFALWSCLAEAQRSNLEFMSRVVGRSPHELYGLVSYGNGAAFLIGSGAGLAAAAAKGLSRRAGPWAAGAAVALLAMTFGGIYFMETERIWLYAVPWLAAVAAAGGPFTDRSLRLLLAAGSLQALLMEILLFTLW